METNTEEYKEHLEEKYLPGRDQYLQWVFFPKVLRQFSKGPVVDLGFGTGAFLRFLKAKKRTFSGIDFNPYLVEYTAKQGFDVKQDDLLKLDTITTPIENAVIDNVLEHLDKNEIDTVFSTLSKKMAKGGVVVVIVPLELGYKRDPTHKTFVNKALMEEMSIKHGAKLVNSFFHPINITGVGKWFYLNMQVYAIRF